MRLPLFILFAVGLGGAGLLLVGAPLSPRTAVSNSFSSSQMERPTDSIGARLLVERRDDMLRVQGAFTNDRPDSSQDSLVGADTLTYKLDVRRTGGAGTSQSTQSGRFDTVSGQTDTLSTVRINVQSGDQVDLHLTIRRNGARVDEVRRQRTF